MLKWVHLLLLSRMVISISILFQYQTLQMSSFPRKIIIFYLIKYASLHDHESQMYQGNMCTLYHLEISFPSCVTVLYYLPNSSADSQYCLSVSVNAIYVSCHPEYLMTYDTFPIRATQRMPSNSLICIWLHIYSLIWLHHYLSRYCH